MRIYDEDSVEILKSEKWQLDLLKLNPSYVHWGNYEDYMSNTSGWRQATELQSIDDMWELDEYNEIVNFYFEVTRDNHQCPLCEGEYLNKETKQLSDDWYDFAGTGRKWSSSITDIEIEALVKHGRLSDLLDGWYRYDEELDSWKKNNQDDIGWIPSEAPVFPSPEVVNKWNEGRGFGHDAINKWICIKARAKHLGIYGNCTCEEGYVYDSETAKVALQLWVLHPRKGCSKGVYIKEIKQEDLPKVYALLREAEERNTERFSKIPKEKK